MHRAAAGDEQAFRDLYRSVQPGLLRYLRVLVGDQDAADVAAETWLQVVRDLASFTGDDRAFRAWVVTIGRHRALDHLRRVRRRPSVETPGEVFDALPASGGGDPVDGAETAMSTARALALIARLPPDQAEAVLLRVVVGLDAVSAAKVLGKRPGAVRVATHRGLRRLAAMLDEAGPEPTPPRPTPTTNAPPTRSDEPAVTHPGTATLRGMR